MATHHAQIERILFPTDFSPFSAQAFRHALALTWKFRARLKVLHVIPRVFSAEDGLYSAAPLRLSPEVRKLAEDEMRQFLVPAREAHLDHEVEICEGDSWREIVGAAEEMQADLVVLGTHGRTGLEHLFLGSVTERLLPRLPCPVLTISHEEGRCWEAPGLVSRILCATDFSPMSTEAFGFAKAFARESRAEVTLLHVIEGVPEQGEPAYFSVPEMAAFRQEHERRAAEQLQKAVGDAIGSETSITTRLVVGRAYKEILRIAAEERADLIVLGAQGHGPIEHLFFGSNALHVIRRSTCPVLTVRPRKDTPHAAKARVGGLVLASPESEKSKEKEVSHLG